MYKIAFITAIYGKYETSCKKYVEQNTNDGEIEYKFICFTDNENITPNNWTIDTTPYHTTNRSKIDDGSGINSIDNNKHTFNIAKYYKTQFHNIPLLQDFDCIIWLDGTIEIIDPNICIYVKDKMSENELICFSHEYRSGILKNEVNASTDKRYRSKNWNNQDQPIQDVKNQYEIYTKENKYEHIYTDKFWDEYKSKHKNKHYGVYITCFVVCNIKNPKVIQFLDEWYLHILELTTQDQVSFSFVCQKLNVIPLTLPNADIKGDRPHHNTQFYIKHGHGK